MSCQKLFDNCYIMSKVANMLNNKKEEMLIIGDELDKDILGGIQNRIDTCWFNPKKLPNNKYKINYEINNLLDLKNIL